jgi:hypothetical protein
VGQVVTLAHSGGRSPVDRAAWQQPMNFVTLPDLPRSAAVQKPKAGSFFSALTHLRESRIRLRPSPQIGGELAPTRFAQPQNTPREGASNLLRLAQDLLDNPHKQRLYTPGEPQ